MAVIQGDTARPRQGQCAQVTQSENPVCSSNLLIHTFGMSATHLGLATFVYASIFTSRIGTLLSTHGVEKK